MCVSHDPNEQVLKQGVGKTRHRRMGRQGHDSFVRGILVDWKSEDAVQGIGEEILNSFKWIDKYFDSGSFLGGVFDGYNSTA